MRATLILLLFFLNRHSTLGQDDGPPRVIGTELVFRDTVSAEGGQSLPIVDPAQRFVTVETGSKARTFRLNRGNASPSVSEIDYPTPIDAKSSMGSYSADGKQYYSSTHNDIYVFNTEAQGEWPVLQTIPRIATDSGGLLGTADGSLVLAWVPDPPAMLRVLSRDPATGKLTHRQAFQSDEKLTEPRRAKLRRNLGPRAGDVYPKIAGAVQVPDLDTINGLTLTPDGRHLFVASNLSIFIFRWDKKQQKLSYVDRFFDRDLSSPTLLGLTFGWSLTYRASDRANANDLIVGGATRLGWFNWDAEAEQLTWYRTWLGGQEKDNVDGNRLASMPCVHECQTLAFSKNGRYLLMAAAQSDAPAVLEVVNGDLKYEGHFPTDPPAAAGQTKANAEAKTKILNLTLSPDGQYVFSRYNNCALKIYKLPERFWK
jgi:WD40 repeat protein